MNRSVLWLVLAVLAAPAFAFLVYRAAQELGFLDPPINRQHELRRTISLAVYAFLIFLPVLVYGFGKRWPRAWVIFGFLDGAALLFFAGSGLWAARELWRIRHRDVVVAPAIGEVENAVGMAETSPAAGTSDVLASSPLAGAASEEGPPSGEPALPNDPSAGS